MKLSSMILIAALGLPQILSARSRAPDGELKVGQRDPNGATEYRCKIHSKIGQFDVKVTLDKQAKTLGVLVESPMTINNDKSYRFVGPYSYVQVQPATEPPYESYSMSVITPAAYNFALIFPRGFSSPEFALNYGSNRYHCW